MTMTYYRPGRTARGSGRAAAPCSGGNALSHRPDAMPGTTLFTPASMCVPPAVHTRLTERDPTAPLPHRSPPSPTVDGAATTYASAYRAPEGFDYTVDHRVRRPAAACTAQPRSPEVQGFGSSTYRMELLQHSRADMNGDHSGGSRAGQGGSASAPGSPAQRHSVAVVRPGYLTTSAAATLPVAERHAAAAAVRASVQQAAVGGASCGGGSPSMLASARTSSCSRPASGAAAAASAFRGSQAAECLRDPPASLLRAQQAGGGAPASPGAAKGQNKDAALYALDQHSRGRVPGYTGHRPQHAPQLELPPPSKLTTWGHASQEALRRTLPPGDASYGIKSSLLGLFSSGTAAASQGFVSENGLAEAACFHQTTRPLEGRMKIPQPSSTNRAGAKFAA